MLGFTKHEVINMMDELKLNKQQQELLLPILKENYDGYKFAEGESEKIYNSNRPLFSQINLTIYVKWKTSFKYTIY